MAKFHVNDKGVAGLCRASEDGRGCPFGGDDKHYESASLARKAFEDSMSSEELATHRRTRGLKASDFVYGEATREDFTAPPAIELLEGSGMLHTIKRVDSVTTNPDDRIVKERPDGSLYIDAQNLAKGHPTFSSSEGVLSRISASLMGATTEVNLSLDMWRLDTRNRYLVIHTLSEASGISL